MMSIGIILIGIAVLLLILILVGTSIEKEIKRNTEETTRAANTQIVILNVIRNALADLKVPLPPLSAPKKPK